jgi:hypothetical protein
MPQDPDPRPASSQSSDELSANTMLVEIEHAIVEVETHLQTLKAHYEQVRNDQQRQQQLIQQRQQVKQQLRQSDSLDLKLELKQLREQIEQLDDTLGGFSENYLFISLLGNPLGFSKRGLQDAFWQIIRFGGLGVILGWLLKSWAG